MLPTEGLCGGRTEDHRELILGHRSMSRIHADFVDTGDCGRRAARHGKRGGHVVGAWIDTFPVDASCWLRLDDTNDDFALLDSAAAGCR